MRPIKFRAWDKVQDAMVNFDIYNVPPYVGQTHLEGEKFERKYEIIQYTGLKDKNGIEIYEGDIVEVFSNGLKGIFEIKWRQDGSPGWILYPAWQDDEMWYIVSQKHEDGNYYDNIEVIGNIYEHPELLERDSNY